MADNYTLHRGMATAHIKRNGRTIAVLPEPCTKAEADAMLAAVQRLAEPPIVPASPQNKVLDLMGALEASLSKAQQRKGTA